MLWLTKNNFLQIYGTGIGPKMVVAMLIYWWGSSTKRSYPQTSSETFGKNTDIIFMTHGH